MSTEPLSVKHIGWMELRNFFQRELAKGVEDTEGLLSINHSVEEEIVTPYGLYEGEELVGYAALLKDREQPFLAYLYIAQHKRRRGLARTLVDTLQVTGVHVNSDNPTAISLYMSMGFHICDDHCGYEHNGFIHFARELPS